MKRRGKGNPMLTGTLIYLASFIVYGQDYDQLGCKLLSIEREEE